MMCWWANPVQDYDQWGTQELLDHSLRTKVDLELDLEGELLKEQKDLHKQYMETWSGSSHTSGVREYNKCCFLNEFFAQ